MSKVNKAAGNHCRLLKGQNVRLVFQEGITWRAFLLYKTSYRLYITEHTFTNYLLLNNGYFFRSQAS